MMENTAIVAKVKLLGELLELHDANPFKVRAWQNAYSTLKKVGEPIVTMTPEQLSALPGLGKNILSAITTLVKKGSVDELDDLLARTPEGIVEMFNIKGIGPKKIARFWHEMSLMSVGELIYYCTENRLRDAKGFGEKSQQDILQKAMLYESSKNKWLYANVEPILLAFEDALQKASINRFRLTGQAFRREQVVDHIRYVVDSEEGILNIPEFVVLDSRNDVIKGKYMDRVTIEVVIDRANPFRRAFLDSFSETVDVATLFDVDKVPDIEEESSIFKTLGIPYISKELRWSNELCLLNPQNLITVEDIKGVIHTHTVYSDGIHSIREMCEFAYRNGYEYIAFSDHSKSASYANGLSIERILQQHREIESMIPEFPGFTILKSIESDILSDGNLDYDDEILGLFDFVIGSVHSGLNMDSERATQRLIKAIEHPFMNILGHMTGRLLLARKGYSPDMAKVIDACVANNVIIELNANPQRLDLDYTQLKKATDRGVKISINPDAHSREAIMNIRYGVIAGRNGGLQRENVINALAVNDFLASMVKK
ncbi:MAG: DNA polymerase IV [Candidatus Parvibacillus calidus]|nr:MAG: DNA polymerase IV [Candidatus Parvibacillus calidus]